ncbi:MAG: hypothetical protein RL071_1203 [Pseudomonadota bacterium]
MTFADPARLQLLWLLLPLLGFLALAWRSRLRALAALGALLGARASTHSLRNHRLRLAAGALACGLLILALAGPRLGFRWQQVVR